MFKNKKKSDRTLDDMLNISNSQISKMCNTINIDNKRFKDSCHMSLTIIADSLKNHEEFA